MKKSYNVEEIVGKTFNRLTLKEVVKRKGRNYGRFSCECGKETITYLLQVLKGETLSCGCAKRGWTVPDRQTIDYPREDLAGYKFNRLEVISFDEYVDTPAGRRPMWMCKCDCGTIKSIIHSSVKHKAIKSCGCARTEPKLSRRIEDSALRTLYSQYKSKSKAKGRDFKLTVDEFKQLTSSACNYCGNLPNHIIQNTIKSNSYTYNGIDRIDSSIGYLQNNVVACCEDCNRMKLDHDLDFFKQHLIKIYNKLNLKEYDDSRNT